MLKITELDNDRLKSLDCEARAIIICDCKYNYQNLNEFGKHCISLTAECGEPYISRWKSPKYQAAAIPESIFWETFNIIDDYILLHITNGTTGKITKALAFWDDWNNRFQVIEIDNLYYGISWWTTA